MHNADNFRVVGAGPTCDSLAIREIRQQFRQAVRSKLLRETPVDSKIGGEVNRRRDHNVDRTSSLVVLKQLESETNVEWALIALLLPGALHFCVSRSVPRPSTVPTVLPDYTDALPNQASSQAYTKSDQAPPGSFRAQSPSASHPSVPTALHAGDQTVCGSTPWGRPGGTPRR